MIYKERYVAMDGRAVYNFAMAANQEILKEMLERNNGLSPADLRYIVPHQANLRIIQAVAKREKILLEKFFVNIDSLRRLSYPLHWPNNDVFL